MSDFAKKTSELPASLRDKRQLGPEDEFSFGCHPGVPCFNDCCGDVNIVLTPFDILRIARHLGLKTDEFLDRHTMVPITKDLHLPVVMLKMSDEESKRCSFVGESGCTIYDSRPWACRMYPVMSALPPARAEQQPEPMYFLAEDDFCHGHSGTGWTVPAWMKNQGADLSREMDLLYQEIVSHPWFIGGRQLNPKQMEMFFTACYDIDNFRRFVFKSSFLERFELGEELVAKLRDDDEELLRFAFRWLRFALFAEPTMEVQESAKREVVPPSGEGSE